MYKWRKRRGVRIIVINPKIFPMMYFRRNCSRVISVKALTPLLTTGKKEKKSLQENHELGPPYFKLNFILLLILPGLLISASMALVSMEDLDLVLSVS